MGAILPPNPSLREGVGGGKYFSKQYLNGRLHAKFQLSSTKIEGVSLNGGGWFLPPKPSNGVGIGGGGKIYLPFLYIDPLPSPFFYLCLSLYLYLCLVLSLSLYFCLIISLSFCLSLSLSLSVCLCLSVSFFVSVSFISLSIYISLFTLLLTRKSYYCLFYRYVSTAYIFKFFIWMNLVDPLFNSFGGSRRCK